MMVDGSRFMLQTEADCKVLLKDAEETRLVNAVMEGVADMEAGRMRPADDAMAGVMKRLSLHD
ncbi:hypothetical protein BH11ARM2_BH11ARM2_33480 [soil metagenome]